MEAQNALEARMDKIQAERTAPPSRATRPRYSGRPSSPVVGNAKGDVTVIEFFDYNCGYCKRAFTEIAQLVEKDKQVKLIMKEFPILSKGSEETAKVALAAKAQGKYWEFHRAMLEAQGQTNEAAALRVAEKVRPRHGQLKKDMASAEVKKEIDETRAMAGNSAFKARPIFLSATGHPRCAGEPARAAHQDGHRSAQGRLQGLLAAQPTAVCDPRPRLIPSQNRRVHPFTAWRKLIKGAAGQTSSQRTSRYRLAPTVLGGGQCPSRFSC